MCGGFVNVLLQSTLTIMVAVYTTLSYLIICRYAVSRVNNYALSELKKILINSIEFTLHLNNQRWLWRCQTWLLKRCQSSEWYKLNLYTVFNLTLPQCKCFHETNLLSNQTKINIIFFQKFYKIAKKLIFQVLKTSRMDIYLVADKNNSLLFQPCPREWSNNARVFLTNYCNSTAKFL